MSENQPTWTASQKIAFPYTQRGASEGLTATEALAQYRSGGGRIRDASWYALYKEAFAQVGVRDKVTHIPMTYTVPETMFEKVDYDYRRQYVMQMEVRGWCEELGQNVTRWVSIESDNLLTKGEWLYGAQKNINDRLGSQDLLITSVLDWNPVQRSGELKW